MCTHKYIYIQRKAGPQNIQYVYSSATCFFTKYTLQIFPRECAYMTMCSM